MCQIGQLTFCWTLHSNRENSMLGGKRRCHDKEGGVKQWEGRNCNSGRARKLCIAFLGLYTASYRRTRDTFLSKVRNIPWKGWNTMFNMPLIIKLPAKMSWKNRWDFKMKLSFFGLMTFPIMTVIMLLVLGRFFVAISNLSRRELLKWEASFWKSLEMDDKIMWTTQCILMCAKFSTTEPPH